jgi:hypothetical protein
MAGSPALEPPRLPDPAVHAHRQRAAIARLVLPAAARLLVVDSVSGNLAVLREADGTVIDEEVAVAGARVFPGDRVVRLPIPGRGDRDAAGSFVVVGPVNPVRGTPTATVGPAAGSGATVTVAGTDAFCRVSLTTGAAPGAGVLFTLTWSLARPDASYGTWIAARGALSRVLVANGLSQEAATNVACPVGCAVAPAASTLYGLSVWMVDA